MGLFDNLFGKKENPDQSGRFKIQTHHRNREYDRIHKWIESRVGNIDTVGPVDQTRLDALLNQEKARYPSIRGKLSVTQQGNDTIVTGDGQLFKRRLKRLGCKWNPASKCWVAKNKKFTEKELDYPGEVAGLEAYMKTIGYRKNLEKTEEI
jgi:hypothetical protein